MASNAASPPRRVLSQASPGSYTADAPTTQSYESFRAGFPHLDLPKPEHEEGASAPAAGVVVVHSHESLEKLKADLLTVAGGGRLPDEVDGDASGLPEMDEEELASLSLPGEVTAGRMSASGAKSPKIEIDNFVDDEDVQSSDEDEQQEGSGDGTGNEEVKDGEADDVGEAGEVGQGVRSEGKSDDGGSAAVARDGKAAAAGDDDGLNHNDAVSAFSLDSEFDYDNCPLTQRFGGVVPALVSTNASEEKEGGGGRQSSGTVNVNGGGDDDGLVVGLGKRIAAEDDVDEEAEIVIDIDADFARGCGRAPAILSSSSSSSSSSLHPQQQQMPLHPSSALSSLSSLVVSEEALTRGVRIAGAAGPPDSSWQVAAAPAASSSSSSSSSSAAGPAAGLGAMMSGMAALSASAPALEELPFKEVPLDLDDDDDGLSDLDDDDDDDDGAGGLGGGVSGSKAAESLR